MTAYALPSLSLALRQALARRTCEFEVVVEPADLSARYIHGGGRADLQARRLVMSTRLFDAEREAELRLGTNGGTRLRHRLLRIGTAESQRVIEGTRNWLERGPGDWFAVDSADAGLPRAFGDPFWRLDLLPDAVIDRVDGELVFAYVDLLASQAGPFEVVPRGTLRRALSRQAMRWASRLPLKIELEDGELVGVAHQERPSGRKASGWGGFRVLRWEVPFEWPLAPTRSPT